MSNWAVALQRALGVKVTPENTRFLNGWQRWEGGHTHNSAKYNWLNTTHGPGSSINGVGVRRFSDFQTGIRSTAETLMNGRYDDIVAALRSGRPYAANLDAGLSTWVSGSPTARLDYARKVMGGAAVPKAALPRGGRGPTGNPGLAAPPPMPPGPPPLPDDLLYSVWGDMAPLYKQLVAEKQKEQRRAARPARAAQAQEDHSVEYTGKMLVLPTKWKSTHVTDNLSEEGFRSAVDIMGNPGTPVGAPEAGKVIRWGSAQGGSSIWFKADSGRMYWIGHIDNIATPGTRVKRGQVIARISADHPRPHVHLDAR